MGFNVPNAYLSLAGFEVTIIGRFWVTAEVAGGISFWLILKGMRLIFTVSPTMSRRGSWMECFTQQDH